MKKYRLQGYQTKVKVVALRYLFRLIIRVPNHSKRKRMRPFSNSLLRTALVSSAAACSLLWFGCGGHFASVFYNQKNPQAIQRDTVLSSGEVRSTLQFPDMKGNGVIKLAAVEMLRGMDSVTITIPSELAAKGGTFSTPRKLYVPSGFTAEVYAWDLGDPQDVVVRDDGTVFVSDMQGGRILAVGAGGKTTVIASGLRYPYGMEIVDGALYYTDETKVFRYDFSSPTSTDGKSTTLTDQVPKGGDFYTRTIRYVPSSSRFYISIGATDGNGEERDKEHATVFSMPKEGGRPSRASYGGLRNTTGMDVRPETGELWGIEAGMDDLSEQLAPAEINVIKIGKNYGHPYFYSQNFRNPKFVDAAPALVPKDPVSPIIELQAYSDPTDLQFYTSDGLGADWKNAMLVVYKGYALGAISRPAELRTGFKVVRVRSKADGSDARQADFISGWLGGDNDFWGQPVGIGIARNGKTFFVSDAKNGVVYKFVAS